MKQILLLILFLIQYHIGAQNDTYYEKPPVFPDCEDVKIDVLQNCFDTNIFNHIYKNFKIPQKVLDANYVGEVVVLFEVDTTGAFRVIYVDAMYDALKLETKRVFSMLSKIKPATYNGKTTYKQYSIPIKIPLVNQQVVTQDLKKENKISKLEQQAKTEYDNVNKDLKVFESKAYNSQLNIPFTHSDYSRFDRNMNLLGTNSHTASKPFVYDEVSNYYDFKTEKEKLEKETNTWAGKKLWNEHLVQLQGKDYWFTMDPIFDLQWGSDANADFDSTYNNTRGLLVQGGLGEKFNFYTSIFESQGRFAEYINVYAETLKAFGPDPAIIPGRGIAKRFKSDSYDYPVAEAYLSYTPTKYLNVQFGHAKNFIGDGYRSLFVSDVVSPHPFLKLNTKFWKIKYTNTWMWLRDVRDEVTEDGAFLTKYMANHYLSWNVSKRFNLGFFESVIWTDANNRGFDVNYLNPVVFYRAIEFETGQDANNELRS